MVQLAQTSKLRPFTYAQMLAAEQTDLSGTYSGTFVCDAAGINGETTLTINGNEFTTADGKGGRIVATTTRGYTAVALQFNDAPATAPPVPLRCPQSCPCAHARMVSG